MDMIILALLIGAAFGFALDRVGATNPDFIIGMLRLSNLHLMKAILLAIGVASVGLFAGILGGVIDVGHMSIKTAYWGVLIGGVLLGVGFAISGYCPGTGLTAAATGRYDAFAFIAGGLVGAFAYMLAYAGVKETGILENVAGGKASLGEIAGSGYPFLIEGVRGEHIGIALGVAFILIAMILPSRLRGATAGSRTSGDFTVDGSSRAA